MRQLLRATGYALLGCSLFSAASPDQWKGLIIGGATPEQVRSVLGSPKKESIARLYGGKIEPLLGDEIKKKSFVRWEYADIEGFSRVDVAFKDDKLVGLFLSPKGDNKVLAREISSIYDGVPFVALLQPQDLYGWNDIRKRAQRSFPTTYHIAAMTPKTFLVAVVMKGVGASILSDMTGADEHFPGRAIQIQYFSRTLEKPNTKNSTLQ